MRIIATAISVSLFLAGCGLSAPEARVTIRVIDENGLPVPGADVGVSVMMGTATNQFATQVKSVDALTGANGEAHVSIASPGNLAYGANKEGYHRTLGLEFKFEEEKMGKWQPWNPKLEVKLKTKRNPIAMYVRSVDRELPKLDENIGFDLIASDWVKPYGKGEVSDFIFFLSKRVVSFSDFDATLKVGFSNLGDGIQSFEAVPGRGSILKSEHEAPSDGYEKSLELRRSRKDASRDRSGQMNSARHYYFRVRTRSEEGKVLGSLYGKIYGDIEYRPIKSATAKILFKYYLNPDGSRNVEFDPARNLFGNSEEPAAIPEP